MTWPKRPVQNFCIEVEHPVFLGGQGQGDDLWELNLHPALPDYITPDGVMVWIERPAKGSRSAQKTRFLDKDGNQVGPVLSNLAPAIVYAAFHGWRDPGVPDWFNDEHIAEVRAGGSPLDRHGDELLGKVLP